MRSPSDQTPALTSQTPPAADSDYDSIHAAVMETVRGRWFLSEYARRNRHAETDVLLKAIGRIESFVQEQAQEQGQGQAQEAGQESAPGSPDAAPLSAPKGMLDAASAELALVRDHIRNVTDSLIECGAPSFLTNDLKRQIGELSRICAQLVEMSDAAQPLEAAVPAEASMQEAAMQEAGTQEVEASVQDEAADVIDVAQPQSRRDPYADIRALSDIEKIALFT